MNEQMLVMAFKELKNDTYLLHTCKWTVPHMTLFLVMQIPSLTFFLICNIQKLHLPF